MSEVLDKGSIKLIDSMGNDDRVAQAARVLLEEDRRGEPDKKLIRYMLKHKHMSPFEHVIFTFYIKAPIFVMRQWMRHRTWSFNEVSLRYKEADSDYYIPELDIIGIQHSKNHQSRDTSIGNIEAESIKDILMYHSNMAFGEYQYLLGLGCPREVARMILPLNTYTELVATVKLRNLLEFFDLRSDEHAQYEIREYSHAMERLIEPIVPVTMQAYRELKDGRL